MSARTTAGLWIMGRRRYRSALARAPPVRLRPAASERDLRAHLHAPLPREPEAVDRARRVAGHEDEQPLAPGAQARTARRHDGHPRDEVGRVLEVEVALDEALLAAEPQRRGHVELVLVARPDRDV